MSIGIERQPKESKTLLLSWWRSNARFDVATASIDVEFNQFWAVLLFGGLAFSVNKVVGIWFTNGNRNVDSE